VRVLVAHNLYRSALPSGENHAVMADIALLREAGMDVVEWLPSSDAIQQLPRLQRAGLAISPVSYPAGRRKMEQLLRGHRPDLVHVHNVVPFISGSAVAQARHLGVPVVQTVHNYRIACMAGTHVRDGRVCRSCLRLGNPAPGALHGCYRGSRTLSLVVAAGQVRHHRLWRSLDGYIALTPFMRRYLVDRGVAADRIHLRPSWADDPGEPPPPGDSILFAGRLDATKGVQQLLDAAAASRAAGWRVRVAGTGPLATAVAAHPDVEHLGWLDRAALSLELWRAGVVVLPSLSLEGLPLTLVEALAHGRAVVVPRSTSSATVVDDQIGWVYDGSVRGLRELLAGFDSHDVARRGMNARQRYVSLYSAQVARERLIDIYSRVVAGGANG
jgi:glycosyltransferase involved in cell wall biosynthesis